jgi:Holliday junction resolvase RusA-like endonuclease
MRGGKPVIGKGGRPMIVVHADGKSASYESLIRLAAAQALGDREPTEAPIEVEVTAYRLPPSSWLKGVRKLALAGGLSCTGKPDPDNIAKAVLDACNGVVWHDDAQVVGLTVRKRFAPIARLEVAVTLTGIPAPPR